MLRKLLLPPERDQTPLHVRRAWDVYLARLDEGVIIFLTQTLWKCCRPALTLQIREFVCNKSASPRNLILPRFTALTLFLRSFIDVFFRRSALSPSHSVLLTQHDSPLIPQPAITDLSKPLLTSWLTALNLSSSYIDMLYACMCVSMCVGHGLPYIYIFPVPTVLRYGTCLHEAALHEGSSREVLQMVAILEWNQASFPFLVCSHLCFCLLWSFLLRLSTPCLILFIILCFCVLYLRESFPTEGRRMFKAPAHTGGQCMLRQQWQIVESDDENKVKQKHQKEWKKS